MGWSGGGRACACAWHCHGFLSFSLSVNLSPSRIPQPLFRRGGGVARPAACCGNSETERRWRRRLLAWHGVRAEASLHGDARMLGLGGFEGRGGPAVCRCVCVCGMSGLAWAGGGVRFRPLSLSLFLFASLFFPLLLRQGYLATPCAHKNRVLHNKRVKFRKVGRGNLFSSLL